MKQIIHSHLQGSGEQRSASSSPLHVLESVGQRKGWKSLLTIYFQTLELKRDIIFIGIEDSLWFCLKLLLKITRKLTHGLQGL